ncbi:MULTISPECIES: hypothetical protein [Bacillus]|uniref:hypothetical protein n=1 Tax=Bacillus TaxID=1386 RepID=UPI0030FB5D28
MKKGIFNYLCLILNLVLVLILSFYTTSEAILLMFIVIFFVQLIIDILQVKKRLVSILFVFIMLYSVSAFIAMRLGYIYFYMDPEIIVEVTGKSLASIILAYIFITISSFFFSFPSVESIKKRIRDYVLGIEKISINICILILCIIAGYFWSKIIFQIGINALLSNPRIYATVLFEHINFYHQIILIPISIILAIRMDYDKDSFMRNLTVKLSLALAWSPLVLVGARKELFIFVMGYFIFGGMKKLLKYMGLILIAILMLFLPLIREGWSGFNNIIMSFHEFIMPQYASFIYQQLDDVSKNSILDVSGYMVGINAMIPGFLRIHEYIPLGESTFTLGITNVGIATHFIGEAVLNFPNGGYLLFSIMYTSMLLIIVKVNKISPMIFVLFYSYLIVIGRSDFWLTMFFCCYSFIFIYLLTFRKKKQSPEAEERVLS